MKFAHEWEITLDGKPTDLLHHAAVAEAFNRMYAAQAESIKGRFEGQMVSIARRKPAKVQS